jgi:hypothetical protein
MLCTECHTSNAADYKFCRECGRQLPAPPADGTPEAQVEQLLSRAFHLVEQGSLPEAEAAAQAALAVDPESSSAHSVLALIYERQGKVPQAIQELELVLARNPASTVDRAKLEALRGNATTSFRRSRWTPQQITTISAVAAGIFVFGGGVAIITAQSQKGTQGTGTTTGALQPIRSAGTSAPTAITPARPLTPLPTPPTPLANRQMGPVAPAPPAAVGSAAPQVRAAPLLTAPQRSTPLRSPLAALPTPRGTGGSQQNPAGLPVAGIGEVVPLPQAPATAPGSAPAVTGVPIPTGPAVASGAVPAPPAAGEAAKPVDSAAEKPKKELLEPETGFIKIEPIGAAKESRGPVTTPKGPPPTISVAFASSGSGDDTSLEEAQRAQRNAQSAVRRSNADEAERQYRRAAELFETLARRGGSSAKQAREGLDACKKALASLR